MYRHKETTTSVVFVKQLKHSTIDGIMQTIRELLNAVTFVMSTDEYTDPCGEDGPYLYMQVYLPGRIEILIRHGDIVVIDSSNNLTAMNQSEFDNTYEQYDN